LSSLLVLALLAFSVSVCDAQGLTWRFGKAYISDLLRIYTGGRIENNGFYRQSYGGTVADAFQIDYTGIGNNILNFLGDGSPVATLSKAGVFWTNSDIISEDDIVVNDSLAIGPSTIPSESISLRLEDTVTATSGTEYAQLIDWDINPSANSTGTYFASWIQANVVSGNSFNISSPGIVWGMYLVSNHQGTGTLYALVAQRSTAWNNAGGSVGYLTGVRGIARNDEGSVTTEMKAIGGEIRQQGAGGTVTSAKVVKAEFDVDAGTVTDGYGFYFEDHAGTGTITNQYGLYIENVDGGSTLNYAIYSAGGDNYFAGETIYAPSSDQVIDAVGDSILANATTVFLNPDGDYTLTSTPTIADGTKGQILYIMCNNAEANIVTVQDEDSLGGSNLELGAASRAISGKDVLTLIFDGVDWTEQSYTDN
jgi:hypothetical protein